jgi:hypothetical protein
MTTSKSSKSEPVVEEQPAPEEPPTPPAKDKDDPNTYPKKGERIGGGPLL